MTLSRHAVVVTVLSATLAVVAIAAPASALGRRGDADHIAALREDSGGADAAPEIDAGAGLAAIALVAGVVTVLRARRRA